MKSPFRFWMILSLTILVILITFWRLWGHQRSETDVIHVQDVAGTGTPSIGGAFTLMDHMGKVRRDTDFRGKFMLVYFGYSYCPDICPTALSVMTEALKEIGGKARNIQPIFITIDPKRDTVEHLALYMENFHPSFIALTGTDEQIKKAIKAYKVYSAYVEPDDTTTEYLMDHSSIIYIMSPQGDLVAHYNHETLPSVLASGLKKILK